MAESREPPIRKDLTGGAIEVVLICQNELPREEQALALLREQVTALREMADAMERIAQDWSADLEAGRRYKASGVARG